jgi:sporulation protein YlmC with PRC-barrel domain
MRKISMLLSVLVLAAMILAACGGEETSTSIPTENVPPITAEVTGTSVVGTATEVPIEVTTTGTPGVPVTGEENPARLSNELDFTVWNQDGKQIGEVDDMVLDLDNPRISYIVVGTGGFLDLNGKEVLVPWDALQLQTGAGDTTGGQQNAFILQTDQDTFNNSPDVDLNSIMPATGQPAGDWDAQIRSYWQGGGTVANTPSASGTTGQTPGQGQGLGLPLQGVMLASEVLGSEIKVGNQGQGTGTGQGTGQSVTTTTPGLGNMEATIDDLIVDTKTSNILYLVLNTKIDDNERLIPIPLSLLQWDSNAEAFVVNANPAMLRDAPSFEEDQYPDTAVAGWDSEILTFWQNNGSGQGPGAGAHATATP